ncbi:ankyrin repeat protein [Colletotrichum camelliae]|nr:ankyrin repeat protein [Colletotrichum camelliae]
MTDGQTSSASDLATPSSRKELPPAKQTKSASRAHFLELPVEIILQIVDAIFNSDLESLRKGYDEPEECQQGWYPNFGRFSVWRTAFRLAKTCRALNSIVTPAIYQADIKWNRGSSLLLGAKTGSASTIRKALEAGAEIDMWDFTELYDDFYELQQSMNNYPDVTRSPTEIDMTALHWAAYHRNVDAMTVLLEHGANVRTTGVLGPLFEDRIRFACAAWCRVVLYFKDHFPILQKGEDRTWLDFVLQGRAEGEGPNVLYYALTENYETEIWYGLAPYTQEQQDRRQENKLAAVKRLLKAGASMTTHSTILLHALHQACGNWDEEMVEFLLENGADVHARDILGNTSLHYVAMCRYSKPPRDIVRVLLRHGADINAVNKLGRTPLQVCFQCPSKEKRRNAEETNFASLVALLDSEPRLFPGIMQLMCRDLDDQYYKRREHLVREAIALAFGKTEPALKGKKGLSSEYKTENEVKTVLNTRNTSPRDCSRLLTRQTYAGVPFTCIQPEFYQTAAADPTVEFIYAGDHSDWSSVSLPSFMPRDDFDVIFDKTLEVLERLYTAAVHEDRLGRSTDSGGTRSAPTRDTPSTQDANPILRLQQVRYLQEGGSFEPNVVNTPSIPPSPSDVKSAGSMSPSARRKETLEKQRMKADVPAHDAPMNTEETNETAAPEPEESPSPSKKPAHLLSTNPRGPPLYNDNTRDWVAQQHPISPGATLGVGLWDVNRPASALYSTPSPGPASDMQTSAPTDSAGRQQFASPQPQLEDPFLSQGVSMTAMTGHQDPGAGQRTPSPQAEGVESTDRDAPTTPSIPPAIRPPGLTTSPVKRQASTEVPRDTESPSPTKKRRDE